MSNSRRIETITLEDDEIPGISGEQPPDGDSDFSDHSDVFATHPRATRELERQLQVEADESFVEYLENFHCQDETGLATSLIETEDGLFNNMRIRWFEELRSGYDDELVRYIEERNGKTYEVPIGDIENEEHKDDIKRLRCGACDLFPSRPTLCEFCNTVFCEICFKKALVNGNICFKRPRKILNCAVDEQTDEQKEEDKGKHPPYQEEYGTVDIKENDVIRKEKQVLGWGRYRIHVGCSDDERYDLIQRINDTFTLKCANDCENFIGFQMYEEADFHNTTLTNCTAARCEHCKLYGHWDTKSYMRKIKFIFEKSNEIMSLIESRLTEADLNGNHFFFLDGKQLKIVQEVTEFLQNTLYFEYSPRSCLNNVRDFAAFVSNNHEGEANTRLTEQKKIYELRLNETKEKFQEELKDYGSAHHNLMNKYDELYRKFNKIQKRNATSDSNTRNRATASRSVQVNFIEEELKQLRGLAEKHEKAERIRAGMNVSINILREKVKQLEKINECEKRKRQKIESDNDKALKIKVSQINELEKELKLKISETNVHKSTIKIFKTQIKAVEEEVEKLKENNNELVEKLEQCKVSSLEVNTKHNDTIGSMRIEILTLKESLSTANKLKGQESHKLLVKNTFLEKLRRDEKKLKSEKKSVQNKWESAKAANEAFKEEIKKLKKEEENTKLQILSLKEEKASLIIEKEKIATTMFAEIKQLKTQKEKLTQDSQRVKKLNLNPQPSTSTKRKFEEIADRVTVLENINSKPCPSAVKGQIVAHPTDQKKPQDKKTKIFVNLCQSPFASTTLLQTSSQSSETYEDIKKRALTSVNLGEKEMDKLDMVELRLRLRNKSEHKGDLMINNKGYVTTFNLMPSGLIQAGKRIKIAFTGVETLEEESEEDTAPAAESINTSQQNSSNCELNITNENTVL